MLQIHTMPYPDGAIKGTFNSSSIIPEPVPAVYGAALIDPFTGEHVTTTMFLWSSCIWSSCICLLEYFTVTKCLDLSNTAYGT